MALKFAKKHQTGAGSAAGSAGQPGSDAKTESKAPAPSFLKKGTAAKALHKEEEAKAAARQSQFGAAFRFFIPYKPGTPNMTTLTFLDGNLDDEGMLDIPYFKEHTIKVNGQWTNFVCTEDDEGHCPICASDTDVPAFVGALTVIDHTGYTIKSGANAGTFVERSKKLFIAKRSTLQVLTAQAHKRGGLAGCTFEVTRTGDREPRTGNQFDFEQKDNLEELRQENQWEEALIQPLIYAEAIVYTAANELAEMGLGPAMSGPGTEKKSGIDSGAISDKM